jgi:hypothetical protein
MVTWSQSFLMNIKHLALNPLPSYGSCSWFFYYCDCIMNLKMVLLFSLVYLLRRCIIESQVSWVLVLSLLPTGNMTLPKPWGPSVGCVLVFDMRRQTEWFLKSYLVKKNLLRALSSTFLCILFLFSYLVKTFQHFLWLFFVFCFCVVT